MGFLEHFQQNNQTLENIFQSIFWNATKHLKIFSFSKNIFTWKYFILEKYFTINQVQPLWDKKKEKNKKKKKRESDIMWWGLKVSGKESFLEAS